MSLRNVVIMSFANGEDEAIDAVQHELGKKFLHSRGCYTIDCHGVYKGQHEKSVIVPIKYASHAWAVDEAQVRFKQESVLAIKEDGTAVLVYQNGQLEVLGHWQEISECDAWAQDHTQYDGKFYTAVNNDEHVLH